MSDGVSISCTVYLDVIRQSLIDTLSDKMLPRVMMNGTLMKITYFFDGASGMRVISIPVYRASNNQQICFEITPTMQGFIKRCKSFDKMTFNIKNGALSLLVQSACCALRYDFPIINIVDDTSIDHTQEDTVIEIPTTDWLEIWKTIPDENDDSNVIISHKKGEKAITLKHSKSSWAAVIQIQQNTQSLSFAISFICPVSAAKLSFANCISKDTTSFLHFLKNTVLCWSSSSISVYLAPYIAEK